MNDMESIGNSFSLAGLVKWPIFLFLHPRQFFAQLSRTGGYGSAVLYAAVFQFLAAAASLIVAAVKSIPSPAGGPLAKVIGLLLLPWLVVGLTFVLAGVVFVVWHLMGSKEDYRAAFRCLAFMAPVALFGAVLGFVNYLPLLSWAFGFYLLVTASIEYHRIPSVRAWAVWSLIFVGLLMLGGSLAVVQTAMRRSGGFSPSPSFGAAGDFPVMPGMELTPPPATPEQPAIKPPRAPAPTKQRR